MALLSAVFQKMNQRERGLVMIVFAVIFVLAGKIFVVDELLQAYSAYGSASEQEAELARSQSMLAEVSAKKPESLRNSPLWAFRKENSGLGNLMRKVSSESEAKRDFSVRKITAASAEKLPEYDKTKFEIEVEGPFHAIGNFLEELESSHFLTRVESVQVFRIEDELRLCRARILVNSFSWREP